MRKRIMSALTGLTLAMGAVCAPLLGLDNALVCAQWGGNGLSFTTENGVATITDCDSSAVNVDIPSQLGGCTVAYIGESAFQYCDNLTSVKIPDSVTYIGEDAFYGCESLSSITIPANVTKIDSGSFAYCSSLTSIYIPNKVTYIGNYTFLNCSKLCSISIPDSVSTVGEGAFNGTAIYNNNPNGVVMVDGWAVGCVGLYSTDIVLDSSTRGISDTAFRKCTALDRITIPDSVLYIGASAFEECLVLSSVRLSNRLRRINDYTFYDCPMLTSISIPDSVVSVGTGVFNGTALLSSTSGVTYVDNWAVDCSNSCSGKLSISTAARGIADSAISNCSSITSASVPSRVKAIGSSAFSGCSELTEIVIENGATEIGEYAFYKCSSLRKITIPSSVKTISANAFSDCSDVTVYGYSNTAAESIARSSNFRFESLGSTPEPFEPNTMYGDVDRDGTVGVNDVFNVLRYDAEMINLDSEQYNLADVNGDAWVTSVDALLILQYTAEVINAFPRS